MRYNYVPHCRYPSSGFFGSQSPRRRRISGLRSSPKFRGAPWHDNVSTDIHDRGNPTYARVVLFFSALVAEEGDLRGDQHMGFALLKWYRQHGKVVQSHGMRQASAMGDTGNGGAAKVQGCVDAEHCKEGDGDAGLCSGLPDETTMFWVNQYAWISGRSQSK